MGVIQYFMPGVEPSSVVGEDKAIRRAVLAECGLVEALRDVNRVPRDASITGVRGGPGKQDGVLITPTRADGEVGQCVYLPDKQTWVESENGRYWLGTASNERVRPLDVQRRRVFLGFSVGVEDDSQWIVPIARSDNDSRVTLPQDIRFVNGEPIVRLREQYRQLWDLATAIVGWCAGDDNSPANDRTWRIRAALLAINTNYRVWHDEINLAAAVEAPILSTDLCDPVCLSVADIQFAVEVKKKGLLESGREVLASASSSNGIGDGSDIALVGVS